MNEELTNDEVEIDLVDLGNVWIWMLHPMNWLKLFH